jgi:hypothetical protein
MMQRIVLLRFINKITGKKLVITLFFILAICQCGKSPVATGTAREMIDVAKDPVQDMFEKDSSVVIEIDNGEFTLAMVVRYDISGEVVCKQRFTRGWSAKIAQYDLTLCWGKITEDYVRKHIAFSHHGRWYHYRYTGDCPVSNQYIIEHTSNNHIVPANENVSRAIGSIRTNTPVRLWGFLVDIHGVFKDNPYWWYTSRIRTDTGAHSCEILYVTKVQIGKDIYE